MRTTFRPLALGSAFALALAACKPSAPPQPPPPEVGVVEAKSQTVPLQRELVGRLSPFRSSDVRARVAGVLLKRVYTEGSDVKEGQLMFQIDPAPLKAVLDAAQANLTSAQATYANAHVAAERARQLAPQKYVSASDLDSAEANERSSAAAVQQAQANVNTARINLGYTAVTAPISGRSGMQQVTEGALVGQGDTTLLTTIDQIDPLYVNFAMAVNEYDALKNSSNVSLAGQGQAKVSITLSNGSTYDQPGTIDFADATVDPSTGSVSLRAKLPNPDKTLLPGSFVSFKADLGTRTGVFLVPQAAVLRDTVGPYAMVVGADGNVTRKNLTVDGQQGSNWAVTGGLATGDKIVVDGLQKVKEGQPAKPTPWQPQAAPGAQTAAAPAAKQ